jgi:hypothetical protein
MYTVTLKDRDMLLISIKNLGKNKRFEISPADVKRMDASSYFYTFLTGVLGSVEINERLTSGKFKYEVME